LVSSTKWAGKRFPEVSDFTEVSSYGYEEDTAYILMQIIYDFMKLHGYIADCYQILLNSHEGTALAKEHHSRNLQTK